MLTRLTLAVMTMVAPTHAAADDVNALFEAMNLPVIVEVMREEGLEYGEQIAQDLFPDRVNSEWPDKVAAIYDYDAMRDGLEVRFGAALGDTDIDPLIGFFESDTGQTIIELEVAARRALMNDDLEAASQEIAAAAIADETARFRLVEQFVEANDLVETNVVGAMNANYAFYIGLLDGGAFPQELTEDQILADVWSQETEIRANTYEWVYSYLMLAYQPLSDEDLEDYIAFSSSPGGKALNTALFVAFDDVFEEISRALGLASSEFMAGQDL
jgi:hypothetical protein